MFDIKTVLKVNNHLFQIKVYYTHQGEVWRGGKGEVHQHHCSGLLPVCCQLHLHIRHVICGQDEGHH